MQIYYYTETDEDQRAAHKGADLTPEQLQVLGVIAHHFPTVDGVNQLAESRDYKNRDEVNVSPQGMGEVYEEKVKMFFKEHLHEDEEIRYILDGRGYFDVRDQNERWVRCALDKGDLIILPAGIWHRFTTDENNYVKAMRLFKDEPKWTPLNRVPELEENKYRKEYVQSVQQALAI
ncbi:Acireductone dioxygenase ARD family [Pyronema omphalodes]|nr:Acireductone dioxygenase ARD family [Pyronema omphalodes]